MNETARLRLRYALSLKQSGRCARCRAKLTSKLYQRNTAHLDHVNPRSNGGADEACNLELVCATCNLDKSNRLDPGMQHTIFDKPARKPWSDIVAHLSEGQIRQVRDALNAYRPPRAPKKGPPEYQIAITKTLDKLPTI